MQSHSRRGLLLTGIGCLCLPTLADAHHSFGTFDLNRNIEIVGTIDGIDFVNPHSWLRVDARGPDGSDVTYRCEMRGATVLRRSGWAPEMFVAGEQVTVQGAPDRLDPLACYVHTLVLADGRTLDRYTQRAAEAAPAAAQATAAAAEMPRTPNGSSHRGGLLRRQARRVAASTLVKAPQSLDGQRVLPFTTSSRIGRTSIVP